MIKQNKEIKCSKCEEVATNFHSKCCNAHFEGVITKGEYQIVCEKCGKFVGELKVVKIINRLK